MASPGIERERELQSQLRDANRQLKTVQAELEARNEMLKKMKVAL
jgi:hypothetical protein